MTRNEIGFAADAGLLASDVILRHPFRMDAVHGPAAVLSALEDMRNTVGVETEEIEAFRSETAQALIWRTQDGRIEGCTLTLLAGPKIAEIRIMLRPVHELAGWRDRLRALAAPIWEQFEPMFGADLIRAIRNFEQRAVA